MSIVASISLAGNRRDFSQERLYDRAGAGDVPAIAFLAGSGYVSGHVLICDGGPRYGC